jgi:ASC-1-like (ASCH) protein
MKVKTLWIKDEYLQQILDGRKTIEVRVGYRNIRSLQTGDRLLLNERHEYQIVRVAIYDHFEQLLQHESPQAIAPHLSPEKLLPTLRKIYPKEKEALGVVALEIHPVK